MSETTKKTQTISRIERLTSSRNGNPRFRFGFTDATEAILSTDAAFGYEVGNPGYREGDTVEVSYTAAGRVTYMRAVESQPCPNCGGRIALSNPDAGHEDGCILSALLGVLEDRGHELGGVDLSQIDAGALWDQFGGPATDAVAVDLGLTPYPED